MAARQFTDDTCGVCFRGRHFRDGAVYVVIYLANGRALPFAKVGFTRSPLRDRERQIATHSPFEVDSYVLRKFECPTLGNAFESKVHADLAKHRVRGEWFEMCGEVLDYLHEHGLDLLIPVDYPDLIPEHFGPVGDVPDEAA